MIELVYFQKRNDDKYIVEFECNRDDLVRMFGMAMESVSVKTKYGYIPTGNNYVPEGWDKTTFVETVPLTTTGIYIADDCAESASSVYRHSANKQREE